MKYLLLFVIITIAMSCTQQPSETTPEKQSLIYPETTKEDLVDDYFGTEVPDPYRWLEDDMSEETGAWVKAQNDITFTYLKQIPFRNIQMCGHLFIRTSISHRYSIEL